MGVLLLRSVRYVRGFSPIADCYIFQKASLVRAARKFEMKTSSIGLAAAIAALDRVKPIGSAVAADLRIVRAYLDEQHAAGQGDERWWGVWCERPGPGFWRTADANLPLQTTRADAERRAANLNESQLTRTDSMGWHYEARRYTAPVVAAPPDVDTKQESYKRTTTVAAPPAQPMAHEWGEWGYCLRCGVHNVLTNGPYPSAPPVQLPTLEPVCSRHNKLEPCVYCCAEAANEAAPPVQLFTLPATSDTLSAVLDLACQRYGGTDGLFNAANFSCAYRELVGGSGLDGRIVQMCLTGRSDIQELSGCHYRRVAAPPAQPVAAELMSAEAAWYDLPESISDKLAKPSFIAGYNHAGVVAAMARDEVAEPAAQPPRCAHPEISKLSGHCLACHARVLPLPHETKPAVPVAGEPTAADYLLLVIGERDAALAQVEGLTKQLESLSVSREEDEAEAYADGLEHEVNAGELDSTNAVLTTANTRIAELTSELELAKPPPPFTTNTATLRADCPTPGCWFHASHPGRCSTDGTESPVQPSELDVARLEVKRLEGELNSKQIHYAQVLMNLKRLEDSNAQLYRENDAALARVVELEAAARDVLIRIISKGTIQNHGHRERPGNCTDCIALNALESLLAAPHPVACPVVPPPTPATGGEGEA